MNIANMSLGDGQGWGYGDGAWKTRDAIERRVAAWKTELNIDKVFIRRSYVRTKIYNGGYRKYLALINKIIPTKLDWSPLKIMPEICHQQGVEAYLYVSLFDEGWPLLSAKERKYSYHNKQHCRHVSAQTKFSYEHPEYAVVDRTGKKRQWGVLCLAYPEVRQYFIERYLEGLKDTNYDGLFVCFRSQSKPAEFADQYGFNEPIRKVYLRRYGKDILKQDFELCDWQALCGEYVTQFLMELKAELVKRNIKLAVGYRGGEYIGPPMGNIIMDWRYWAGNGIIDDLIINQDSSRCPSFDIDLWPMHRGYGYNAQWLYDMVQDHTNYVSEIVNIYISRQWNKRNQVDEQRLLNMPGVAGLVFSAYKHDNPAAVARACWRSKHT